MAKRKYYVVWQGKTPGIYEDWESCKAQVFGEDNARYKSFETKEEAITAYRGSYKDYFKKSQAATKPTNTAVGQPIRRSLAVDAACSGNPGDMEYRGVFVETGQQLFIQGPFKQGTNNVGEFLALVHGLAYLKQQNIDLPLYSDSRNAILWVKNKKCKTKLEQTAVNRPIFDLIERAERWLHTNTYTTRILKWETEHWGEIPADFGRK